MTLTNILCNIVITLATNTVESDNRTCEYRLTDWGAKTGCASHSYTNTECAASATERTVTTTVTERVAITFPELSGHPVSAATNEIWPFGTIVYDREKTELRTVKRYRRSVEWVEVVDGGAVTNTITVSPEDFERARRIVESWK